MGCLEFIGAWRNLRGLWMRGRNHVGMELDWRSYAMKIAQIYAKYSGGI
jgi:hypothetical protein